MKKTVKTLMTAALFAASAAAAMSAYDPAAEEIQDVYGPAPDYPSIEETNDIKTDEPPMTTTETDVFDQPVYGPPWVPQTESTTTTVATNEPPIVTTMQTNPPAPVYGPPWVMIDEKEWLGDLNLDGSIDVYDMVALRNYLISGEDTISVDDWEKLRADVNKDGEVGMADLIMLQKYLLGSIDSFPGKE